MSLTKAYANARFGPLHYRRQDPPLGGERLPLLCLHPSPMSGLVFEDFLPVMGADRVCVAADTPGYGLSDPPPPGPSIGDYAEAMGDLIDELGFEQVDLFGYHTGCAIGLELALRRPNRIGRIVLNSALMFTPEEITAYRAMFAVRGATPPEQLIATVLERWASWRAFWRDVPDETRAWALFWEAERNAIRSTWGFNAVFDYDFPKTLAMTRHPLLILNPEDDLYAITPRAAAAPYSSRIHDLPGWTHGFLNTYPEQVAQVLRTFLDA
jgi:pimeloyl-ACP methyl ester carboxylesterase